MISVGEALAETRRKQGLSLKDIEKTLKIRVKYLSALEQNAFEVIPGEVYIIGFLKSYADYLNLNSRELIEQYRSEHQAENKTQAKSLYDDSSEKIKIRRRKLLVGIGVILFLVFIGVIFWTWPFSAKVEVKKTIPVKKETRKTTPKSIKKAPEPKKITLKVKANDEKGAWLRITVDGKNVYEGVLPSGQEKEWTAKKEIIVRSGNATRVEITKDGRLLGPLDSNHSISEKIYKVEENNGIP